MKYLEFIEKSNFELEIKDYFESIKLNVNASFNELNPHIFKVFNKNLTDLKLDYFQSLSQDIQENQFEKLKQYILIFILEPFENSDIDEFEKITNKINQKLESEVENENFLNFIWEFLDQLLHQGLINSQSDIYEELNNKFSCLDEKMEIKHLLIQKIEQII